MKEFLYQGFTDGSGDTKDLTGGWAFVLKFNGYSIEFAGYEENTTNNRMEIQAVLQLLKYLDEVNYEWKDCVGNISITSDSQYVINSITKWRYNWEKNGWKSGKDPVKNKDLWLEVFPLVDKLKPEFIWVKGHAGHQMNERCDELAGESRITKKLIVNKVRSL